MSTRSAIITKTKDGYQGVYCHSDGYLEGVGYTLRDHYSDDKKVKELISLGHLSVLGDRALPISGHTFDVPEDGTTIAYHRDRGDRLGIVTGPTAEWVADRIGHDGHVYVWNGKCWSHNGRTIPNKK